MDATFCDPFPDFRLQVTSDDLMIIQYWPLIRNARIRNESLFSKKKILITNNVLLLICYFWRKAHFHDRFVRKIEVVPWAYFQWSRTTGSEPLKQYFFDIMVRFYVTGPPYWVYLTLTLYTVGHLKSDSLFVKIKRKSGPEKSGYSY